MVRATEAQKGKIRLRMRPKNGRNAPIRAAAVTGTAAEAGVVDVAQLSVKAEGAATSHQTVGCIADWMPQLVTPRANTTGIAPFRLRTGRRETTR
jgi:hypothetical protein